MHRATLKTILFAVSTAFLLSLPFWAFPYTCKMVNGLNTQEVKFRYYQDIDLPKPIKQHYDFIGWYDKDGDLIQEIHNVIGNMEITAQYEPETYKIEYDDNLSNSDSYKADENKKLPEAKKEHYIFKGWSYNDKTINSTKGLYEDLFLSPVFEPEQYTIHLNTNGGQLDSQTITYTYGQIPSLPTPSLKNHIFTGWYTSEDLSQKANLTETSYGDMTLYAGYKKITNRNLAKPYIVCGDYAATLQTSPNANNDTVYAILDGPAAWHEFVAGHEYVADHNYQGATAFVYNDECSIVREDGSIDNYKKVSSTSLLWQPGMSVSGTLSGINGYLITQTCEGDNVNFYGWEKME